jgi:non-ribosomal peptide synthetase component F
MENQGEDEMRIMFLAGAAALAMGIAPAFADGGDVPATTAFTTIQDQLAQQAQSAPQHQVAVNPNANQRINATRSDSVGTWLFPPYQGGGQN